LTIISKISNYKFSEKPELIYKKMTLNEINSPQIINFIEICKEKWNSAIFDNFLDNCNKSQYNIGFYIIEGNSKTIFSIANIKSLKESNDLPWISSIIINWLIDPMILYDTFFLEYLNYLLNNDILINLVKKIYSDENIPFYSISNVSFIIPERKCSIKFIKFLHIDNWKNYINFAEEKQKYMISLNEVFLTNYHFYWYNSEFDEIKSISEIKKRKMVGALALSNSFNEYYNYLSLDYEKEHLTKISLIKNFYKDNSKIIIRRNRSFNILRKIIWSYFLLNREEQLNSKKFIQCFRINMKLIKTIGYRFLVFSNHNQKSNEIIKKYKYFILSCLIECLNSEGSSYCSIMKEDGHINQHFFHDEYIKSYLGDYFCILELNISNKKDKKKWIFAGLAFSKKKTNKPHILISTLLFPKIFRGYGLGQFLGLFSMQIADFLGFGEKFEVYATSRNSASNRLINKIGFFYFGFIQKMLFDITGFDSKDSYAVGMNRSYYLGSKILKAVINQNNHLNTKIWQSKLNISINMMKIIRKNLKNTDFIQINL